MGYTVHKIYNILTDDMWSISNFKFIDSSVIQHK